VRRAALIFAVAAFCSCGPAGKVPVAGPQYAPAKTLYKLKWVYNAPDIKAYGTLFAPARFTLKAEAPPAGFPERWGFREEMEATRALFANAYHIVLEMETTEESVGTPPPSATSFTAKPIDVRVRVWREPTYCFYARGKVTFRLTRPNVRAPWLIAEWVDATGGEHADVVANEQTGLCSWTDIKWYYLKRHREGNERHKLG
jgi:hypothetical protein